MFFVSLRAYAHTKCVARHKNGNPAVATVSSLDPGRTGIAFSNCLLCCVLNRSPLTWFSREERTRPSLSFWRYIWSFSRFWGWSCWTRQG